MSSKYNFCIKFRVMAVRDTPLRFGLWKSYLVIFSLLRISSVGKTTSVIKQLVQVHALACTIELWSTQEVWRARKKRKPEGITQEKRSQNCLRWPRLCLHPLLSRNIIFFPALTIAARAKKNIVAERNVLTLSACTIGILSTIT